MSGACETAQVDRGRKGVLCLAIAACAVAAPACGSGKPVAHPPATPVSQKTHWVAARPDPLPTHRVVLSRSWTPSVLAEVTHRVDPDPRITARLVYRTHVPPGNPKGWWLVLTDPRLTPNSAVELRDFWTVELVGRMYLDRREPSAVKLSGVAVAARTSDFENGENTLFWGSAAIYSQARPVALRTRIQQRAAMLGLKIRSFRTPRLDGIVAPLVTLQVNDRARFKRWYDPGCAEGWLFGPRADTNGSPYWGFFLSITDSSGGRLYSMAATPNEGSSAASPRLHELLPPPPPTKGIGGMRACPARFAQ